MTTPGAELDRFIDYWYLSEEPHDSEAIKTSGELEMKRQLLQLISTHTAKATLEARIAELELSQPYLQKHTGLDGNGSYYYDDRMAQLKMNRDQAELAGQSGKEDK